MIGGTPVKGLILTGHGRAFAAGADVAGFVGRSADEVAALARAVNRVFSEMEELPIPVVAVIDGFALGGGNELAMSAHYRIATRAALFGQPEVKLGIFPGYGGMQRLPRLTGIECASRLAVNGEMIDAHTALAVGLVDEIHPPATALRRGYELVARLAAGAPVPWRRDWEALGVARRVEADSFFAREDVQELLRDAAAPATRALDVRSARMAAAREALAAMDSGLRNGFAAGIDHDSAAFGAVVSSPGGQEWIRRFLDKDPLQGSSLTLLPSPRQRGEPAGR
jgi:enoyl-CoA hydratase/carnithine racemase